MRVYVLIQEVRSLRGVRGRSGAVAASGFPGATATRPRTKSATPASPSPKSKHHMIRAPHLELLFQIENFGNHFEISF